MLLLYIFPPEIIAHMKSKRKPVFKARGRATSNYLIFPWFLIESLHSFRRLLESNSGRGLFALVFIWVCMRALGYQQQVLCHIIVVRLRTAQTLFRPFSRSFSKSQCLAWISQAFCSRFTKIMPIIIWFLFEIFLGPIFSTILSPRTQIILRLKQILSLLSKISLWD